MPKIIAQCTIGLGTVSLQWANAIKGLLWPMNTGETNLYMRDGVGGEIAETRNAIVDAALIADEKTPISHLFWIDDDVIVAQGALLELLHQAVPICSGVYFSKREGDLSEPLIFPKGGGRDKFRPNAIYDVDGHGMGLTLIELEVYKRMRDELKLPLDKYGRTGWYHTSKQDSEFKCDENGIIDTGHTEDLFFLANARKLGYQPRIVCTKHAFGWHFQSERRTPVLSQSSLNRLLQKGFSDHQDKKAGAAMSIFELSRIAAPLLNDHLKAIGPGPITTMEQGHPIPQWQSWIKGEPVVWDTPEGRIVWE